LAGGDGQCVLLLLILLTMSGGGRRGHRSLLGDYFRVRERSFFFFILICSLFIFDLLISHNR
jgi:hypothetical protein